MTTSRSRASRSPDSASSISTRAAVHGLCSGIDADGFPARGYLLVAASNRRFIDGALTTVDVAIQIASYLQDTVIDERGSGWPKLTEGARFVTILTPRADHRTAWWAGREGHEVAFGDLASVMKRDGEWSLGESNS